MLTEILLTIYLSMIFIGVLFYIIGALLDCKIGDILCELGSKLAIAWVIITIICIFVFFIDQIWR